MVQQTKVLSEKTKSNSALKAADPRKQAGEYARDSFCISIKPYPRNSITII